MLVVVHRRSYLRLLARRLQFQNKPGAGAYGPLSGQSWRGQSICGLEEARVEKVYDWLGASGKRNEDAANRSCRWRVLIG